MHTCEPVVEPIAANAGCTYVEMFVFVVRCVCFDALPPLAYTIIKITNADPGMTFKEGDFL